MGHGSVALAPSGAITCTHTARAVLDGGAIAVIEPSAATVKLLAGVAPKSTAVALARRIPVRWTAVPPAVDPLLGLSDSTIGIKLGSEKSHAPPAIRCSSGAPTSAVSPSERSATAVPKAPLLGGLALSAELVSFWAVVQFPPLRAKSHAAPSLPLACGAHQRDVAVGRERDAAAELCFFPSLSFAHELGPLLGPAGAARREHPCRALPGGVLTGPDERRLAVARKRDAEALSARRRPPTRCR